MEGGRFSFFGCPRGWACGEGAAKWAKRAQACLILFLFFRGRDKKQNFLLRKVFCPKIES